MCWVFPVFMLDACFHRDPYLRINEHFSAGASWAGAPVYLDYTNWSVQWSEKAAEGMSEEEKAKAHADYKKKRHWQLQEITKVSFSDAAVIGNSPKGWFIADLGTGELQLFPTSSARDLALQTVYHLDPARSFGPAPWLMRQRSNSFWPWVDLYYVACFIGIPWLTIARRKGRVH